MSIIDKIKAHFSERTKPISKSTDVPDEKELSFAADSPSTVAPLTSHDRYVAELQRSFSGQVRNKPVEVENGIYVWRKADEYTKKWLPDKGYAILESAIFDDCIGYKCIRNGCVYTVFMYACEGTNIPRLSAESCAKLAELPFAQDSIVLILYLNVCRYSDGLETKYRVRYYSGDDNSSPELWLPKKLYGRHVFQYFPCKEILDQTFQFMYAFNREDTDIYDCIITDNDPSITGIPGYPNSRIMNEAFYRTLLGLHREYGDMKLGYVRYGSVVYCAIPYIENLGFFSWNSYNATNRMHDFILHSFNGSKENIAEFIKTEQREADDLFGFIPKLVNAVALPPAPTERFSVKLFFDNGECRKYLLPISDESEEVVSYQRHVFSDGIWASVAVVSRHDSSYADYPECGCAIMFKNGFFIAGTRCYLESTPYSEPVLTNEIVYSDANCRIRKLWSWEARSIYEDNETGLLKTLFSGQAFNSNGLSVFATIDGKRMTGLNFDFIDSFNEGLARVAIHGHGYGFVDENLNLVIPMKYNAAGNFNDGKALARRDDKWILLDKSGRELELGRGSSNKYQEICNYSEGMCRVSTLKLRFMDLAYHSDYDSIAGTWGFLNESGKEVIPPQYIYANDFNDGIAIVAKGNWTIDPKWDNEYCQGRYWRDEELWGAIDKDGNEVIPFIFDEIKEFSYRTDMFIAHYGGWREGRWGVIDRTGKWLAEPIFEGIDYESCDDLIVFYAKNPDSVAEDIPLGIYDLASRKTLFEPQFYNVDFLDNGDINVEVFDRQLGRRIEKIIDRTGKECFKSVYSYIRPGTKPYEVVICDEGSSLRGLIDVDGSVILPCVYNAPMHGIMHEQRRICFIENGKQGLMDYDGNIIVPADYHSISGYSDAFLTVSVGDDDAFFEGLITHDGKVVLSPRYKYIHWCKDRKHFFGCSDGCCEMYVVERLSC